MDYSSCSSWPTDRNLLAATWKLRGLAGIAEIIIHFGDAVFKKIDIDPDVPDAYDAVPD